ncbi:MAG: arginine--tRNA ligase [Candidatus Staskawiczbacteria bacterium]|nr:arginine--tRNA ligase [Candidatus Staskawiczbacteria bacterium]
MKDKIQKIISALGGPASGWEKTLKDNVCDFSVEVPVDKNHGDYSTNVALILAKKIGKNPVETANLIKEKIGSNKLFSKIEIAGPGFINFFVKDKFFIDNLKKVDKNYGKGWELKSQKVILDYTDPNPFKEFHVGHLMNNAIGESLSRIFEFQGAKVKRACYQGDVGIHVAKALWGKMQKPDYTWGMAYAFGSKIYEESETSKKEIIELNKTIYNRSDEKVNKLYDEGKADSLKHFDEIYKVLGTKFDYFIFESETGEIGKKIVEKGLKDGVFEKGDNGAIIFKGEKVGLHTRVFINSEGLPTYGAKDLALAEVKYKKYKYDKSVVVTAVEQNSYFEVMLTAMKEINPKLAEKTKHIGHGMMRLPDGKMSSRTGNVITGESLLEKVEQLVQKKIRDRELDEEEKEHIAQKVAVGALKYSILKQSIGSDIIYDFNKSISFEGDSGPYLQYSYARAESVLRKAKAESTRASFSPFGRSPVGGKKIKITQLEKAMSYFPDVVLKASQNYQPNIIALYLTELASEFNAYYAKNKIVDKADEFSPYRVAVTSAFSKIMKNGLWLLGIEALEKM